MSPVIRNKVNEVIQFLPMSLRNIFVKMSPEQKNSIKEIRLRMNRPIVIVTEKGAAFLSANGKLSYIISQSLPLINTDELNEVVKRVCGYSVYSHQNDMINGFITIRGGHRVGLCGTAVVENGRIISVKDVNSINIRVAGEVIGCADDIVSKLCCNGLRNIIIAGEPMSGKTTVLRDLIRQVSDGNSGEYYKCAVVDERGEIASVNGNIIENDIGPNCDVLSGYPKNIAVSQAIRTLSPDIVFCDETSSEEEVDEILDGAMCGVKFVVSVHAASLEDMYKRKPTKKLLESGVFEYIVFLGKKQEIGKIKKIVRVGESLENSRCDDDCSYLLSDREYPWQENA